MGRKLPVLLAVLLAAGFLAYPTSSDAVTKKAQKRQPFSKTSAFIDFSKFEELKGGSDLKPLGKVEFKSFGKKPNGLPKKKKKKDAVFKFGEPVPATSGPSTVDIELVSLSLVSRNVVPLAPLGGGANDRGNIVLSLVADKASKGIGKVKFGDTKKTGKFDASFDKFLKVKSKDGKLKKPLLGGKNKLPVKFTGVPFSQNSPITVTSSFCFGTPNPNNPEGDAISEFCLNPLSVPEPNPLLLLGIGVVGAAVGLQRWRRKPAGGMTAAQG